MRPDAEKPELEQRNKPEPKNDLKSLPMPELLEELGSSPGGLSQAEAQKRLAQYGPNEIKEEKTNAFLKFLTYFWGPIPWMIEAAVILSGIVWHWLDFFIILLLLCSNAVVAVFGVFMTPLGWGLAAFVWVYTLAWLLVNDRVKLLAYRFCDPTKAPLLGRKPLDLTPQIAARAYELYQERVHGERQQHQDWHEAEREIRNDQSESVKVA